ncbi:MAG: peroxide stress protein YaaA [Clostridium sp.]|uniref:peroxide stress protein YaaA n=1 Tax=Clostridium sp. TaxID=1506 RepID=UPI003F41228C
MIVILSPAKKIEKKILNFDVNESKPMYMEEAKIINDRLKEFNPDEIASLMKIGDKLRDETFLNIHRWSEDFNNTFPCVLGFNGEAFRGLDIERYDRDDLEHANNNLRILSGLYGVLRPLDLIHNYRLEMGTKLKIEESSNLYCFWDNKINNALMIDIKKSASDILVNLASNEYSKSAKLKNMDKIKVITPVFKELKNGKYKVVTVHAKRARGLMATYIMKNKVNDIETLKKFNEEGYKYREDLSNNSEIVFILE